MKRLRSSFDDRWTVKEVLDRWPAASAVFVKLGMACVGCPMSPFMTLAEAAGSYGLDYVLLERELRDVIPPENSL